MYKLKLNQPDFECVDGPFAGRKYKTGQTYAEIPPNEAHRFDFTAGNPPRQASPATPQEGKKRKEENDQ